MDRTRLRARYRRIVFFFVRVLLSLFVWDIVLPSIGLRGWARRTRTVRLQTIARRFRILAVEMGGVLIKVGQFLSTRVDVLPPEITDELADLQDEVPPEDIAAIRRLAEAELGGRLSDRLDRFEEQPMAAASLGQVHRARLRAEDAIASAGEPIRAVVVKVQRPGIELLIDTDLAALSRVARWLARYRPIRRRANVPALLAEFDHTIHAEVDYLAEGRNAETFRANFQGRSDVCIPQVVWSLTTRRVLVLEDVFAIKINDYAAISGAGIDRRGVADRLFDTYLKQIFEDGFFHADPHPGNLFVNPGPAGSVEEWQLTFVDFGMVGQVTPNVRAGLREMAIGIATKDASRLIRASQILGMLLPGANLEELERAEAQVFEQFWGKTMTDLRQISQEEMLRFALQFKELLYSMPFQVPNDLIFLGRMAAILFGICTGLNPEFNPWEAVSPYAQRLIAEETAGNWRTWLGEAVDIGRSLVVLPRELEAVLRKLDRGQLKVQAPQITRELARLELTLRRLLGGVVFAGLMVSGTQLYLAGQRSLGDILVAGAGLVVLWILFSARPRGMP